MCITAHLTVAESWESCIWNAIETTIQVFEENNARQYGSVSIGEFDKGSMYDLEVPAMWMPLFFSQ